MQVVKSSGRIVPLGSMPRVMPESIEAATHYTRARYADLGISADWYKNYDVAVLATFMGTPKDGPSAGITIVTGIVSALKKQPVRHDLAMTGEITILGKVLPVGGIHQKVRAAYDAGVKEVLLPVDNLAGQNVCHKRGYDRALGIDGRHGTGYGGTKGPPHP